LAERGLMRTGGHRRDVRASAFLTSSRGKHGTGSRTNTLWGNGKRRAALVAALVLTLVVPFGASASWSDASWASASRADSATAEASWADLSLSNASWAE
jgi:hypothetical protein